jgi:hypothetical protein
MGDTTPPTRRCLKHWGIGNPSLGRDPKSRARSRDYLKQYAFIPENVSYFSSSHVPPLNPLPSRQRVPFLFLTASRRPVSRPSSRFILSFYHPLTFGPMATQAWLRQSAQSLFLDSYPASIFTLF